MRVEPLMPVRSVPSTPTSLVARTQSPAFRPRHDHRPGATARQRSATLAVDAPGVAYIALTNADADLAMLRAHIEPLLATHQTVPD